MVSVAQLPRGHPRSLRNWPGWGTTTSLPHIPPPPMPAQPGRAGVPRRKETTHSVGWKGRLLLPREEQGGALWATLALNPALERMGARSGASLPPALSHAHTHTHTHTPHTLPRKKEILPRASQGPRGVGDDIREEACLQPPAAVATHTCAHTHSRDCHMWLYMQACADALTDSGQPVQTRTQTHTHTHIHTLPRDLRQPWTHSESLAMSQAPCQALGIQHQARQTNTDPLEGCLLTDTFKNLILH